MATPAIVARVSSLQGEVFAKDAKGVMRPLQVGDPVYEGEVLITTDNGRVTLATGDGQSLRVNPGDIVVLDAEVLGEAKPDVTDAALQVPAPRRRASSRRSRAVAISTTCSRKRPLAKPGAAPVAAHRSCVCCASPRRSTRCRTSSTPGGPPASSTRTTQPKVLQPRFRRRRSPLWTATAALRVRQRSTNGTDQCRRHQ